MALWRGEGVTALLGKLEMEGGLQHSSATLGLLVFLFSTAQCLWVCVYAVSSESANEKFLCHSC